MKTLKRAPTYIFFHVVGHLGQVVDTVSFFFLHVHYDQTAVGVILQNDIVD